MPRLLALGTAAVMAAAGLALVAPTSGSASAATTPVSTTPYTLEGAASGPKLIGGSLPASSNRTAVVSANCLTKVPVTKTNSVVGFKLPNNLGTVGAVTSKTWSYKSGTAIGRYSQTQIASVKIGNALGSLNIDGLKIVAHTWHDSKGFHSSATTTSASISETIAGRTVPGVKLPTPGHDINIPGLLDLSFQWSNLTHTANRAGAYINGFTLTLPSSGTKLRLGTAWAHIFYGVKSGIFTGSSYAVKASLLGGTAAIDPQPELGMPCLGTGGKVQTAALASLPLSQLSAPLSVTAAADTQVGSQTATSATGHTRSYIGQIDLGNGAVVIKGLAAQANVTRNGKGLNHVVFTTNGTTAGSISVNGTSYSLSQLNGTSFSLPGLDGLVKFQTDIVTKTHQGSTVIGGTVVGLRITLLGATAATTSTIDLATARFEIGHP